MDKPKEEFPAVETQTGADRNSPNLDLLMDVELDAALRFGERQMLLRDILGIVPGALIELDQKIEDPVELVVGGKVVARGEVVVVGGCYGLRITEVSSAMEARIQESGARSQEPGVSVQQ